MGERKLQITNYILKEVNLQNTIVLYSNRQLTDEPH
jgi:hypothetical protein